MRLVCISDTHSLHQSLTPYIPLGDLLIHAGDWSNYGTKNDVDNFVRWFVKFPHLYKIFIAGNHDLALDPLCTRGNRNGGMSKDNSASYQWARKRVQNLPPDVFYLEDSAVEIMGRKFYGSPFQPDYYDWAFQFPRGPQMARKWAKIPEDTNVLITHGPPLGILDKGHGEESAGCEDLLKRIGGLRDLRLNVFGHIHESGGMRQEENGVIFVNAAICDIEYRIRGERVMVVEI